MRRLLLLLLIGLLSGLAGCRQTTADTANLTMTVDAAPDPAEVGEATLLISVSDATGNPVTDATIQVRGDMSHAGMTPVIREIDESSNAGVYEVPFEWTMGGDWVVEVTATLPDGTSATERFEYRVGADDADSTENMDMDGMENMDMSPEATETTSGGNRTNEVSDDNDG